MFPLAYEHLVLKRAIAPAIGLVLTGIVSTSPTVAQVIPDGTLSTTVITTDPLNVVIEDGDRVGDHLFHSFDQFSLPTGGSAHFNNAADVDIIFSRVTGGKRSNIDGRLSANGTADVFLLNPRGIVFGEKASLDIGGSFIGTTAESLVFEDGTEFNATVATSTPLLTLSTPTGLQMGQTSGRIHQAGATLQAAAGQTLALVGNGITLTGGTLDVPGGRGRIELISLGPDSSSPLRLVKDQWHVDISDNDSLPHLSLANLRLRDEALVLGSGNGNSDIQLVGDNILATDSQVESFNLGDRRGGGIVVTSANIFRAYNSDFTLAVQAEGGTGHLRITAPIIRFINDGGVGSIVTREGTGNGGNLLITGDRLTMAGEAAGFGVLTEGDGNSGNVVIKVGEVTIQDSAGFGVLTDGAGNSGNVTIRGQRMVTSNQAGGGMSARRSGHAGELKIFVDEFRVNGNSGYGLESFRSGDAGTIIVEAESIIIEHESGFNTSTFGRGHGGNINFSADRIILRDESGLTTDTSGRGSGGNINITAQYLELDNGYINARTAGTETAGNLAVLTHRLSVLNGGQFNVFTQGEAKAGDIEIVAHDHIRLSGQNRQFERQLEGLQDSEERVANVSPFSGIFGNTIAGSRGDGGSIKITTPDLLIEDGARISVSAEGNGNAGNLSVNANTVLLQQQASIQSDAIAGSGGNLFLTLDQALLMTGDSRITTNATGTANGGNIIIQSPVNIVGLHNSDIIANAIEGDGGNIRLNTQGLFGFMLRDVLTSGSDITASSQRGVNGTIDVNNFNWEPDSGIITLPSTLADASDRVVQGCGFSGKSRFVVTGRGGLPPSPLRDTSGDRPWFQILPDFGPIPGVDSSYTLFDDTAMNDRWSSSTASMAPERLSSRPIEATEMAITHNGTLQLVASMVQRTTMPQPSCSPQANIL